MTKTNPAVHTSRARRATGFALDLARGMFKHPTRLASHLRTAAGTILEEQFHASSTIPLIESDLWTSIMGHEVMLSPMALKMPGNQSLKGLVYLLSLAQAIDAKCVFEIGTFNGLTARALAQNLPNGIVHTLDIPPESPTALDLERTDHTLRVRFERLAYENTPMATRVIQHWSDSATFDFRPWTAKCDLIYVDGSHSASYVASDTEHALQMLSNSGAIVWDDYWWRVAGVRAVLDNISNIELRRVPDTRLVVHLSAGAKNRILNTGPRDHLHVPGSGAGPLK